MDTPLIFFYHFYREKIICYILFASLDVKNVPEGVNSWKKELASAEKNVFL